MGRPLVVIGKGAAYSQADQALRALVDATGLPFLATAMGRGVVPDSHPNNVNAARSLALAQADVALIFGARCALPVPDSPSTRDRSRTMKLGVRGCCLLSLARGSLYAECLSLSERGVSRVPWLGSCSSPCAAGFDPLKMYMCSLNFFPPMHCPGVHGMRIKS